MCVGRIVQDSMIGEDNDTITGPVGRLYLWKEWNTHTTVDASSTQVLTIPFSSFHLLLLERFAHSFQNESVNLVK
jgi:hypothetical protein